MKLTADTITDEQIRELRKGTFEIWKTGETWSSSEQMDFETAALHPNGGHIGTPSYWARRVTREEARARCAEIWNARHAKDGES